MRIKKHRLYFTIVFVALLIAMLFLGFYLILRFSPYPDLDVFLKRTWSKAFYDRNGVILQVTPLENGLRREYISIDKIPPSVLEVFIASEDRRFYSHHGIDFSAMFRALYQNISEKRNVSGASTITMQLAHLITPCDTRNMKAKLNDAFNSLRLETRLSKKRILELYLNSLPFGFNTEGVASASRTFFGVELQSLSFEQICCLSVIPRRPVEYNPIKNPSLCAEAAGRVYEKMCSGKSEFCMDKKTKESFLDAAESAYPFEYPFYAPHFIRYFENLSTQIENEESDIYLSLDLNVQKTAEFQVRNALCLAEKSRIENAAVIVIDNADCSVLAWVGSDSWFDNKNNGQVDGVVSPFQPGSSMKPFLYAFSLEFDMERADNENIKPTTVLPDVHMEFGGENLYIPQNFNNRYNGPILFRTALASSLNVPAVYLLDKVGVQNYLSFLERLRFDSITGRNIELGKRAGLGLALGAGEVRLSELTNAFSVFSRDGLYLPLSFTRKKSEDVVVPVRVISCDTSRIICDILSDKSARAAGFGYSQVFETEYPAIFKTGTANQYQNIVALGATTDYTVGVWMGNFSGNTVVGKTGSSLPALAAKNILDYLVNSASAKPFLQPEEYTKIPICAVSGMSPGAGCPTVVAEYVKNSEIEKFLQKPCTWHMDDSNNSVVYPPEYQNWFRMDNRYGSIDYMKSSLLITTPTDGSIFYFDSTLSEHQRISVEVTGGGVETKSTGTYGTSSTDGSNGSNGKATAEIEELSVLYDGKPLEENGKAIKVYRPFVFSLPVEKGKHILTVSLNTESQTVSYEVK